MTSHAARLRRILCVAFLLLLALGCGTPDKAGDDGAFEKDDPAPNQNAYHVTGEIDEGVYVLPNGRRITPAGASQWVYRFPNDVKVAPDGQRAVVMSFGNPSVTLVDTTTMEKTQELFPGGTFMGIVFNGAGDRFWIGGGGSQRVYEYSYTSGVATPVRDLKVFGFPSGMALSPDENKLYVACNTQNRVAEVNLLNGLEERTALTRLYPSDVAMLADGSKLYASNWGGTTVTVIDRATMTTLDHIPTGKNPARLVVSPDGARVYTANADSDSVTVINTTTDEAIATWPLHGDAVEGDVKIGSFPNAIDVSADGSRLYVAAAGFYCLHVLDTATGEVVGRIPTGWFTTGVDVDDASDTVWAVNGKGFGSAATMPAGWSGTVQRIPLPDAAQLAEYTQLVEENIAWGWSFFDTTDAGFESPVPTEFGAPSEQIKHVIFILKENKTFDQVFGDFEGAERDPRYLVFGEDVTPNQHRLARQFTICDNLYVEGDTSIIGHFWATAIQANEFAEKMYFLDTSGGRYPLSTLEPGEIPEGERYLWDNLIENDIDFRIYGQIVGVTHDLVNLAPYMDAKYGFWNMNTLDVDKVDEIIREIEGGFFPPFVYISLPNDHNYGSSSGAPTPDFLVGDNDAALGKLVDYLSHSEYWPETAIFVTEDDPQSGTDHIDKHRTIGLVISPWARKNHISSVFYNMSSMWLTIDLLLGIPPTTKFDQYTAPMYDAFTMTPDYTPYEAMPNPIPFELNEKGLPHQDYCDKQNFLVPDQVRGMGKVLWALKKPGEEFPYYLSVDVEDEEEEEEEAEEAKEYREAMAEIKAFFREQGIPIASETPFWQDAEVLKRLKKHNESLAATGTGGY